MVQQWSFIASRKLDFVTSVDLQCIYVCYKICWVEAVWCCAEILTCGWWSVVWVRRRQRQLLWWESSLRTSSLMRYSI